MLKRTVISLVKNELKKFKKLLSPNYPQCSEREKEDDEDQTNVRDAVLKITSWGRWTKQTSPLYYYVIDVWLNTASTKEDECLLLHHCLKPRPPIHARSVNNERRTQVYREINRKRCSKDKMLMLCCFHCIPSDPNLKKVWINFIF